MACKTSGGGSRSRISEQIQPLAENSGRAGPIDIKNDIGAPPAQTASPDGWMALAERCERATGPDVETDARLMLTLRPELGRAPYRQHYIGRWIRMDGRPDIIEAPSFTASLDAITALIERELPGRQWLSGHSGDAFPGKFTGWLLPPPKPASPDTMCRANTEALARCAAFCRAMAAKEPRP
jgi:hypothetical protein